MTELAQHIIEHGLVVEGDETEYELREAHAWLHAGPEAGELIRHLRGSKSTAFFMAQIRD